MEFAIRTLGALVVTYALSRGLLRLFSGKAKNSLAGLVAIHLLCLAAIAVAVGFLRAYWSAFEISAAAPYVFPQMIWLVIDIARRRPR